MSPEVIKEIRGNIGWLDRMSKSDNILAITQVVNKLQIQAVTLSDDVSEAYEIMNNAEDDYKIAVDTFTSEYEGSTTAAEPRARAAHADKKRFWTTAKNTYKRLDALLDRIDKICDAQRQRISVVKQADLKNV